MLSSHLYDSCSQDLTNVGDTEPKLYCLFQRYINMKTSENEPSGEVLSGASSGN